MLNRRGQALIEFILILPIFLMILLIIVDFGMIFSYKMRLENTSNDIILMLRNKDSVGEIVAKYDEFDVHINKSSNGDYYVIDLKKEIELVTPVISKIMGNPYEVLVKRVIPYEEA